MAKKIAFGCTLLNRGMNHGGIDGIGHYCLELLHQYEINHPEIEIERYSFGETDINHAQSLYPKYPTHLIQGFLGQQSRSCSTQNAFQTADLIHASDHLIPTGLKKPILASIMDVIPLSHPKFIRSKFAVAKAAIWKTLCKRADHIITISEFSKNEIALWMDYPPEKITAIPLGVDKKYFELISEEKVQEIKNKYHLDRPYFLFIGSLQPRKNLARILEAHKNLPGNFAKDIPLVVVGREFWDDGSIKDAMQTAVIDKRCIWLNYLSEWEKRCLLQGAQALCFTSLYEGFGIPILEAFASGTPVITSNTSSMPEIAQECAILVNPLDTDQISTAMLTMISNESTRNQFIKAGLIRAKNYSWEETAIQTQKIYDMLT